MLKELLGERCPTVAQGHDPDPGAGKRPEGIGGIRVGRQCTELIHHGLRQRRIDSHSVLGKDLLHVGFENGAERLKQIRGCEGEGITQSLRKPELKSAPGNPLSTSRSRRGSREKSVPMTSKAIAPRPIRRSHLADLPIRSNHKLVKCEARHTCPRNGSLPSRTRGRDDSSPLPKGQESNMKTISVSLASLILLAVPALAENTKSGHPGVDPYIFNAPPFDRTVGAYSAYLGRVVEPAGVRRSNFMPGSLHNEGDSIYKSPRQGMADRP